MADKLMLTGASGQLGLAIGQRLLATGQANLVFGSRTPEKLVGRLGSQDRIRHIDFDLEESLQHGLHDVGTLFIISTDALAHPGQRIAQHRNALEGARRAGVQRVLYTSMPNPADSVEIPFALDHAEMEADLAASQLKYTILRNSWYQENLLAYLPAIARSGVWYTSAGQGRIAYAAREDIAHASAALAVRAHDVSGVFELAGPEALTQEEIAQAVQQATGKPLRVEHVSPQRVSEELGRLGLDPHLIALVLMTEANQRAGLFEVGEGSLPHYLDHAPPCLADFLHRHAAVFAV